MGEQITMTISFGDLIMVVIGIIVTYAVAAMVGLRTKICELWEAHLGPAARDGQNNLRWYTPTDLVQSIDENSSEVQQLGRHISKLTVTIKEESAASRAMRKSAG